MKKTFFITLIVLGIVLASATKSMAQLSDGHSNLDVIKNVANSCQPLPRALANSKARVVLRIDDVQAFYLDSISRKMIQDAIDKKAVVTLGVIPNQLDTDVALVNFLKRNICNIELAVHGWNHSVNPPEFANLNEDQAAQKLKEGIKMLQKIAGRKIVTFIPPENQYSQGSIPAAQKLGIKAISAEGNSIYDYDASTYDFVSNKLLTSDEVVEKCNYAFSRSQKCIIMLHPQDYITDGALDLNKYKHYTALLDKLISEGASFTTIEDEIHTTLTSSGDSADTIFAKLQ